MKSKTPPQMSTLLSDERIIDLYWARDEKAISATDDKYRRYLFCIAQNILRDPLDSEECLNDTYLGTWNAIPPHRPSFFQVFLSKIMRNTAVVRYKKNRIARRVPSELTVSLAELEECVPFTSSVEEEYLLSELGKILNDYVRGLSERRAYIFVCRYYCSDRVSDIAAMLHVTPNTVTRELTAIREGLREKLEQEGYHYE